MKNTIQIEESITDENTKIGNTLRHVLDANGVFGLNIMASPGAGKTSVILKTIEQLRDKYRIGVIEGDIVPIDVQRIQMLGIPVVLAHTGGSCHLDGIMMQKAISKINLSKIDLLIVENVGNLICPANFYLGTHKNVVIASVPEGDDKPYKYPTMFRGADVVLLNKTDYLSHEQFDTAYFSQGIKLLHQNTNVIQISCRTGEGVEYWVSWVVSNLINDPYR